MSEDPQAEPTDEGIDALEPGAEPEDDLGDASAGKGDAIIGTGSPGG